MFEELIFLRYKICSTVKHFLVRDFGQVIILPEKIKCVFPGSTKDKVITAQLYFLWLPRWPYGKESTCQCRRCSFNPWVGKIPWGRKWQPTPVFLPGEFHGQKSLAGYSPWGRRELDATFTFTFFLGTKICMSFGAGRVGRVEGRIARKKSIF